MPWFVGLWKKLVGNLRLGDILYLCASIGFITWFYFSVQSFEFPLLPLSPGFYVGSHNPRPVNGNILWMLDNHDGFAMLLNHNILVRIVGNWIFKFNSIGCGIHFWTAIAVGCIVMSKVYKIYLRTSLTPEICMSRMCFCSNSFFC